MTFEQKQFDVGCLGNGCPTLKTEHAHMLKEQYDGPSSNLESLDEQFMNDRAEILGSFDGLTMLQRMEANTLAPGGLSVRQQVSLEYTAGLFTTPV